jgi:short subunit dehydrogenase-like uncharacterized protein
MRLPCFVKTFLGLPTMQGFLKARIDRQPEGPSDEARRSARALLVGVARNEKGESVRARLTTPEGYTLTALTAPISPGGLHRARSKLGFQTLSLARLHSQL